MLLLRIDRIDKLLLLDFVIMSIELVLQFEQNTNNVTPVREPKKCAAKSGTCNCSPLSIRVSDLLWMGAIGRSRKRYLETREDTRNQY